MLKELSILNFAIIDRLELTFALGFNVFTGETGAGKSIILDAVSAVVGGKTDATMVREGAERASIEAVFTLDSSQTAVLTLLEREDLLDDPQSEEVTLSREIRAEGRSSARINGRSVNAQLLRELGQLLVDIHGQSDHLSLLNAASHIALVDHFAENHALLQKYQTNLQTFRKIKARLSALKMNEDELLRQKDMLTFQINEIQSAQIKGDEETALVQERDRLANTENLSQWARRGMENLEGRQNDFPGILELGGYLQRSLENLAKIDPSLNSSLEQVVSAVENLNDVLANLQEYQETLEYNPRKLEAAEERLQLLSRLKRKYGSTLAAVLDFEKNAALKLSELDDAAENSDVLMEQQEQIHLALSKDAQLLSQRRKQAAQEISRSVEKELNELHMNSARFTVAFDTREDSAGLSDSAGNTLAFNENGYDQLEFLIAPNPGEGFKPLVKIASGGETSRLMLALKNTLAGTDPVPVLIFDEIDQGIGGRVGAVVGEKLWSLSRNHQVLCITHLPQLAAYRDTHFRVFKKIESGRTFTTVEVLDETADRKEIAVLLGSDSDENLIAADAMLKDAANRKKTEQ